MIIEFSMIFKGVIEVPDFMKTLISEQEYLKNNPSDNIARFNFEQEFVSCLEEVHRICLCIHVQGHFSHK